MEQTKLRQALFPDTQSAGLAIKTMWYDDLGYGSYSQELLFLDEARDIGYIVSESYTVLNSHGTDTHSTYHESDHMPLNRLAATVEQMIHVNPQKYGSKGEKSLRELQAAAEAFRRASIEGRELLQKNYPITQFGSLLYVSHSTAIFEAWDASKKTFVVRMQCVAQEMKAETDEVYKRLTGLGFAEHMIPVWRKEWLPLDDSHIILVTWMPLMERFCDDTAYRRKMLIETEALCLGKSMAIALAALHRRGLVHHDVKPENLFVRPANQLLDRTEVYLGDYSSVKPVERQYQGCLSVTRAYAAPEILEQKPYSYSCDVYSWYRTLMYMSIPAYMSLGPATSEVFTQSGWGVGVRHQGKRFPSLPSLIWPCKNDALLAVIEQALQTDPELRLSDGAQLLQALEAISPEHP